MTIDLDKEKESLEKNAIKQIALESTLIKVKKYAIDALAAYGRKAIPDILEVIQYSGTQEVKTYGLAKVEELKKTT